MVQVRNASSLERVVGGTKEEEEVDEMNKNNLLKIKIL